MSDLDENTEGAVRSRLSVVEALRSYSRTEKDGVTHVYFYIGPSWFTHGLCLITLGVANVGMDAVFAIAGHNNKYFDSDTGEYLSNSEDGAVQALYRQGKTFYTKQEYGKAAKCFKKAYNYCASGYSERSTFQSKWKEAEAAEIKQIEDRRQAAIAKQAEETRAAEEAKQAEERRLAEIARQAAEKKKADEAKLAEERRQAEAARKAEEAKKAEELRQAEIKRQAETARKTEEARKAEEQRKEEEARKLEQARKLQAAEEAEIARKSKINAEAELESKKGMEFWKQGKYSQAKESFESALLACTADYGGKETFEKNVRLAESKLTELERLVNVQKEAESASKLEKAREMEAIKNSGVNENAEEEDQRGMKFWNEGKFTQAQKFFESALLQCTEDYRGKTRFEKNVQVAKWKIEEVARSVEEMREFVAARKAQALKEANQIFNQTMDLWKDGWSAEYLGNEESASEKFRNAQKNLQIICKHFSYVGEYERYREMINFKIRGNEFFNQGVEGEDKARDLNEQKKHGEAAQEFEKSLGRLLEAKIYFEKGREKGGKEFGECIESAMESIEGLQEALGELDGLQIEHALDDLVVSPKMSGKDILDESREENFQFQL